MITEHLYRESIRRHRLWTIVFGVVAAILAVAMLNLWVSRPPECGIRLLGDGTWQRTDEGRLLDGCELVTWEE